MKTTSSSGIYKTIDLNSFHLLLFGKRQRQGFEVSYY